jgi:hypothetical protein
VFVFSQPSSGIWPHRFSRFLDHKQRRATFGRTPLDGWSIRRRDLYLTTHNTHNRQTSMPSVGFESTISAGERPKTYALERAATGTSYTVAYNKVKLCPYIRLWIRGNDKCIELFCCDFRDADKTTDQQHRACRITLHIVFRKVILLHLIC